MYNTQTTYKALGALLALIACAPAFAQKQNATPAQTATAPQELLQLELWRQPSPKSSFSVNQLEKQEAEKKLPKNGDPVWLKVSLKNVGKEGLFTNTLQLGPAVSLLVRDYKGNRVPLTNLGKQYLRPDTTTSASAPRMTLASGSTTAKCYQVNALFDMSLSGNYTVVASLTFPDGHVMKSKPLALSIEYADSRLRPGMSEAREPQAPQGPID